MKVKYKVLIVFLFALLCILVFSKACQADGTRNLFNYDNDNLEYRVFFEDFKTFTYEIPRKSTIKVYAEVGEIIKFGSSVWDAHDVKNNKIADFTIITPSGKEEYGDVKSPEEGSIGLIDTWQKEKNGPYPENGGYIPIEYEVKETGIYSFILQSDAENAVNPKQTLIKGDFMANQGTCIGAWDITVEKDNTEVPGRVYADYLAVNTGNNNINAYFDFYVLTRDGYLYEVNMDGVDPYGCIIFGDNRGCINTSTNEPLYHTVIAEDKDLKRLVGDVEIPLPNNRRY